MTPEDILSHPSNILTDAQRNQYFNEGFTSAPKLTPPELLRKIREMSAYFLEESRDLTTSNEFFDLGPNHSSKTPHVRRLRRPVDAHPFFWEVATSGRGLLANYIQDKGNDLYRRGMYQFIKRTVPPPVMLMFDASNRDQCEVKRLNTNTPLQALVMLNDPHVLEASRVLAEHLIAQEDLEISDKIENAFSRIVCRPIQKEEEKLFEDYFEEELTNFQTFPEEAEHLLASGEYPRNNDLDSATTAAFMQVVHLMYNMEETLTKT